MIDTSLWIPAVAAAFAVCAGVRASLRGRRFGQWMTSGSLLFIIATAFFAVMAPQVPHIADSESGRMIVGMLIETVYFGVGSIGMLLMFLAVVSGRRKNGDTNKDPEEYAKRYARLVWHAIVASQKR